MLSVVEVPIAICRRHPCLVEVPHTFEWLADAAQRLGSGSEPESYPRAAPLEDGFFEILSGWAWIEAAKAAQLDRIKIKSGSATFAEKLHLSLGRGYREGAHPLSIARALAKAKRDFSLTDAQLGELCGIARSTVTRLLNIESKLSPIALADFEAGRFGISVAKLLCTIPEDQQDQLLPMLRVKGFAWPVVVQAVSGAKGMGVEQAKHGKVAAPHSQSKKTTDHLRFETELSERFGLPATVDMIGQGGMMQLQFFSVAEAQGALEQLAQEGVKGRVVVEFGSYEELDAILGVEHDDF